MRYSGPSFVVYIDESGDEGPGKPGASEWLILSAAITRGELDQATVALIDSVRETFYGKHGDRETEIKDPLHFAKLDHDKQCYLTQRIAQARLRTISVFLHKPSLTEPHSLKEKYRMYFYSVRVLMEAGVVVLRRE